MAKSIPKDFRSNARDYRRSGYDRGHLAPSGSIDFSRTANDETFLYSNMVPQLPGFNRDKYGKNGVWGKVEHLERLWVKQRGELYIIAGTYVAKQRAGQIKVIGNGVAVPDLFFFQVYFPVLFLF